MTDAAITIGDRRVARGESPFIVAEIGVNHDGDPDRAIELVHAAASSGVDAVKFQWFRADQLVGDDDATAAYQRRAGVRSQSALLSALELDREAMRRVLDAAREREVAALVSVFSVEALPEAASLPWDGWKTASPDIVHRPLLEAMSADGRPIVASTGGADPSEVDRACGWLGGSAFALLHCVSAYPTPVDRANLGAIASLAEATGRPCGYSDHTAEVAMGGLAVAAGACILEKHLTWSRTAVGPDHAASLEPEALTEYVRLAREAHAALGTGLKSRADIEMDVMSAARQSIRAARPLAAGTLLERKDLTFKRPGDGLEPWRLDELVGGRLARGLEVDEAVRPEDLR